MGLMPQPTAGQPQGQMPQGERDPARYTDETDSNVSPEEQAQYDKFMDNAFALIYVEGGQPNPAVLESLKSGTGSEVDTQGEAVPPHIMALAQTSVTITEKLDDSAREAGKPVTDDVLTQGGTAILEELAEIAELTGIHDYTEDELSGAITVAFDMYRDKAIADGRTDENTLKEQWGQIEQGQAPELEAMAQSGVPQQQEEPNGGR